MRSPQPWRRPERPPRRIARSPGQPRNRSRRSVTNFMRYWDGSKQAANASCRSNHTAHGLTGSGRPGRGYLGENRPSPRSGFGCSTERNGCNQVPFVLSEGDDRVQPLDILGRGARSSMPQTTSVGIVRSGSVGGSQPWGRRGRPSGRPPDWPDTTSMAKRSRSCQSRCSMTRSPAP